MKLLSSILHDPVPFLPPFGASPRGLLGKTRFGSLQITCKVPSIKTRFPEIGLSISHTRCSRAKIYATALSSRCAAEQTQTVTRQRSTITITPSLGKEKPPKLADGGSGFPPRDDGGGGGGGGGQNFSGGFYFFSFLVFLRYLKDLEEEDA
ncbi:hypothetical protein HPP92_011618 [Vanilla planifolia]|uniref:Uncharacterized protein n=1 Tax=Vanilla planifolia TaxID=51239 RepID=A0A835V1Z4_VANPL|nr:hypothetical protein HPP92_011618 [Vanilla planifolia]